MYSADFWELGRAYDTLKDADERRKYDLQYPILMGKNKKEPKPNSTSAASAGPTSEAAQFNALHRSKQERAARWNTTNKTFDSSIFEMKREIRRLEQDIKNLDSIRAAEASEEASKNSWGTWLLSPFYKRPEESEERKAQKDIARQERRVEKDIKERKLYLRRAALKDIESRLTSSKTEFVTANLRDDEKIRLLQTVIYVRERQERERQEYERQARERTERYMRAEQMRQEQQQREAAAREAIEEIIRAAAQQRRANEARQQQAHHSTYTSFPHASSSPYLVCTHAGWWPKVEGRTACPKCAESWTYLLQCPGCAMQACPRCQAAVRPRHQRLSRPRSPSPDYGWWD